jgi:hypothetical protein
MTFLRCLAFRSVPLIALLFAALLFTGCSTALFTRKATDLTRFKRIYVESRLSDNHRIDEKIATELRTLGVDASFGVPTMLPEGVDAIVSYEDRWQWDFKDYMIEIKIDLREARSNKPLATGSYYQASFKTKSSEAVIRLILTPLFRPSK